MVLNGAFIILVCNHDRMHRARSCPARDCCMQARGDHADTVRLTQLIQLRMSESHHRDF